MAAFGASAALTDDVIRRRMQQGLLCVNCGSRSMRSSYRDETTYAEAHSLTGAYTRFPTGVYRVRTDTCQDCGFSQEVRSTPPSPG